MAQVCLKPLLLSSPFLIKWGYSKDFNMSVSILIVKVKFVLGQQRGDTK